MIDRDYALLMAEYNAWMNERVFALCSTLPDADRKRDAGAFFGSIHGTLNHLMWGDRAWLARFLGWSIDFGKPNDEQFSDFDAMWAERKRYDALLVEWAKNLADGALSLPFELHSSVYKRSRKIPTYALVAQMFNHQTHHRGQLHTLLMQQGHDVGITDLPWMPYTDAIAEELPPRFP